MSQAGELGRPKTDGSEELAHEVAMGTGLTGDDAAALVAALQEIRMCAREPPAPPAPNSLRAAGDDATSGEVTALPNMCVQPPPNQQQSRRHQHTAFSGGDAATRICEARSLQGTDRVNQDDDRSKRRVVGQGHAKAYGSAVKDGDVQRLETQLTQYGVVEGSKVKRLAKSIPSAPGAHQSVPHTP